MNHDRIIEILRSEALDDRETGWLSDMTTYRLEYDEDNWAISVDDGSIDLSHLASIVLEILEGAVVKRFKVVQDARGYWGVLDTADGITFAAWENHEDYRIWPEVLDWAIKLNAGTTDIDDFWWGTYRDR